MDIAASAYDSGLICGFRLAGPTPCEEDWQSELGSNEQRWLHFNLSDSRGRSWLKSRSELPEEALEVLLGSDSRVHLEVLPGAVIAVLGDLYHDFEDDPERLGTLRLYLDADVLLSGRTHPLKSVDVLRRDLARGREPQTPLSLFQLLLQRLAEGLARVVAKLGEQVDTAEDRILEGKYVGQGTPLGNLRRLVARLRRLVSANRAALASLPASVPGLYQAEDYSDLRSVIERFDAVGQDLDLVQERARLLQEEIASRMGVVTNRNLFVLSIATTTLLPITLITGIWGMNVGGLPFAENSHGFYYVMSGITVTILTALWMLRRIGAL